MPRRVARLISNSSAFRMDADVPLVIPEVNSDHLSLIDGQEWRKSSGGYIVTNPNCSAIGLVLALKPLAERFGIESVFVTTMQAISGAGYPGVASLDILGNVVPYIKSEEEKLEAETLRLLGKLQGGKVEALDAKISAHCNRVPVEDGQYRECQRKAGHQGHARADSGCLERVCSVCEARRCPRHRSSRWNLSGVTIVPNLDWIACGGMAWRRQSDGFAPAIFSTGALLCSRITRFAELPERHCSTPNCSCRWGSSFLPAVAPIPGGEKQRPE